MTLTTEQLAALKEVAERYRRVHEGFLNGKYERSDLRSARTELDTTFDPTTCLELLEKVERLREVERECLALDKLTDRHLKFDIREALKP
jgi:uncharacterized protein YjiS (DUF1127 family)